MAQDNGRTVLFTPYDDEQVDLDSLEGSLGAGSPFGSYADLDDPSQLPQPLWFTYTCAPRRSHYSPSYIQFETPDLKPDASAQLSDDDLITKATTDAYLTLYQCGSLKVWVNDKHTWELRCPQGCWVKTGIHCHIPLSNKGQFATLEAHWGSKACTKLTVTQDMLATSHFVLATSFSAHSHSNSSLGTRNTTL